MGLSSVLIVVATLVLGTSALRLLSMPEYAGPNICEVIRNKKGYPCEQHKVISDGYILTMERVPYGRNSSSSNGSKRPPVILLHGMGFSSATFIMGRQSRSLAFILAEAGFDVWMPNFRGTIECRKHLTKKPLDADFWDFGQDDMATVDVPVYIDYVLEKTGFDKVGLVGLSFGGTIIYQFLSTRTEYNAKVSVAIPLSGSMDRTRELSPVSLLEPPFWIVDTLVRLAMFFGQMSNIIPYEAVYSLAHSFYTLNGLTRAIGKIGAGVGFGFNLEDVDEEKYEEMLLYVRISGSFRSYIQYLQMRDRGEFAMYDFGPSENYRRYNSSTPPVYDLRKITAPMYIFWSLSDFQTNAKDVEVMKKQLPNIAGIHQNEWPLFNHQDLLAAQAIGPLLYHPIARVLLQHSGLEPTKWTPPTD